jgi:hypothetical protein
MQRRGAGEVIEKLRTPGARERLAELARKAARWAADRAAHLDEDPAVPDELGDREGDVSVPLLAIADDAGGPWPDRVRGALITLFMGRAADDRGVDVGALLLGDIKQIFAELGATRLPSSDVVDRLGKMEHRPWAEWKAGRPMSAPQLARALAPFGVRPGTIRTGAGANQRGYYREAFEEAWGRYLAPETPSMPPPPPSEPPHRHTAGNSKVSGDFQTATGEGAWRFEMGRKPAENLMCGSVAVSNPPLGGKGGVWGGNSPLGDDGPLF